MKKIKIGLVGAGLIGKDHLENYSKIEGAEVVAICDINEEEARRVAQKYGVPHVYTDYDEMLGRSDIDAIDVCLHNNFHAPFTINALKSGKHVYCQKPIAGSYYDGKTMVETAKECERLLHIYLGPMYNKETKAAKHLIDTGKLGEIYHARSTGFRRRGRPFVDGYGTKYFTKKEIAGGGALLDMGVYHISQLLYLLDLPKVERITGKVYQEMEMDPRRKNESGFDVEELGVGFVTFEGGLTLDIIEAWAIHLNGFEGSSIVGSQGGIRMPDYTKVNQNAKLSYHSTISDMDFDSTLDLDAMGNRWLNLKENEDAYISSQHHWIASLQGRVDLLPTSELALQTMLISEGIYLSDKLGREVTTEEVIATSQSSAVKI
jgi:predicted dehydrogenase